MTVTITNCTPDPDPVVLHEGDKVYWESGDGNLYRVGNLPGVFYEPGLVVDVPARGPSDVRTVREGADLGKYQYVIGGPHCGGPVPPIPPAEIWIEN
jgi:hypothetical protein